MSSFAILFKCFKDCIFQNAFTYPCAAPAITPCSLAASALAYNRCLTGLNAAVYGGAGVGNVAVAGKLPVGGTTLIASQVPVIGAVGFDGVVRAASLVSISGSTVPGSYRCGRGLYY